MRASAFVPALLLLGTPAASAQDTLAPGLRVDPALSADLTEEGVSFLLGQFTGFLPPDLVIGTIPPQELIDLWLCQEEFWMQNLVLHTQVNSITADATPQALVVTANFLLWINDVNDPAQLFLDGCLGYVCDLYTDPANITLSIPLTMAVATDAAGDPFIDLEFGALQHNIQQAMALAIHMTGCAVGDIDNWLNENLGFSYIDLVIGQVIGQVEGQITDQLEELEVTGEEALRALWLSDSTDILDTTLSYDISPSMIEHNDEGVRIIMGGATSTEPSRCVEQFELAGSQFTPSMLPGFTPGVPSTNAEYHAAAIASDDFVNQALFALWNGGVLCYTVEELPGFALDTTLFGLLGGTDRPDLFSHLFPLGTAPMVLRTLPELPPLARFDGDHDLDVHVEGLGVQFYPEILGRYAHLMTVAIDLDAGVDISVAPDGALAIDLFLDTSNLNARVTYNEIAPEENAVVEANFDTLVGSVVNLVAGSLLEGMTIALPTFLGQGLVSLDAEPLGASASQLDWLGAYAVLGESTGGTSSGGCDSCSDGGGCSDCSGEGGCSDCSGEGGCDPQAMLEESGCSGESSEQWGDTGCQSSCRIDGRAHRVGKDHWRIVVDKDGTVRKPHRRGGKLGGPALFAVLVPLLLRRRRR